MIRGCARERQAKCEINGASERRDFDGGHPDIMVRRDHRVELSAHGANEHRVGGKWSGDLRLARCWPKQLHFLVAESLSVARVRVQRAKRDARLTDSQPLAQTVTRNPRGIENRIARQRSRDVAERDMGSGEHDAQLIRRQHHRHTGTRELRQHLGVTGIIVTARQQCSFVDRSGYYPVDVPRNRQRDGSLDGETTDFPGRRC